MHQRVKLVGTHRPDSEVEYTEFMAMHAQFPREGLSVESTKHATRTKKDSVIFVSMLLEVGQLGTQQRVA